MLIRSILKAKDDAALTVRPDETAQEAARFLAEKSIGAAVVVGGRGDVVGILSERDIAHAHAYAYAQHGAGLADLFVKNLMTAPVVTCSPDASISDAAQLIDSHHIRHLPVVEGTRLIGVVSIIRDIVTRRRLVLETDVEVLRSQLLERPGLTQIPH